jgi:hypothetical protein
MFADASLLRRRLVRRSKSWLSPGLNRSFDVAPRAHTADRFSAVAAIAMARVSNAAVALNSLILGVSLVLLCGAVWTHAT